MSISRYNTKLGIYEENCGLDNVLMSWGHDEYLYQVMQLLATISKSLNFGWTQIDWCEIVFSNFRFRERMRNELSYLSFYLNLRQKWTDRGGVLFVDVMITFINHTNRLFSILYFSKVLVNHMKKVGTKIPEVGLSAIRFLFSYVINNSRIFLYKKTFGLVLAFDWLRGIMTSYLPTILDSYWSRATICRTGTDFVNLLMVNGVSRPKGIEHLG